MCVARARPACLSACLSPSSLFPPPSPFIPSSSLCPPSLHTESAEAAGRGKEGEHSAAVTGAEQLPQSCRGLHGAGGSTGGRCGWEHGGLTPAPPPEMSFGPSSSSPSSPCSQITPEYIHDLCTRLFGGALPVSLDVQGPSAVCAVSFLSTAS